MLSREINHTAAMVKALQDERVERERLAAIGQMVQRIAHNLRNPLSGIRGMAELTLDDLPPGSGLRLKQERIISAVDKFEGWLSQLLRVTKPLDIRPRRADPRRWIAGVVEAHQAMAAAKGVRLELDIADAPERATFDPEHLEHALVAIVTNAVQATPRDSRVTVRLAREGHEWLIEVKDQGPGVPEEFREQVFRPYFTTKRDGNGIGLAVARFVIHAHGGTVMVEAAVDGDSGALFRVRLPLRQDPVEVAEAAEAAGGSDREAPEPVTA
jgi:signal transduction histidine kinase